MIKYYNVLWDKISKDGTAKVYIVLSFDRKTRIRIPTPVHIEPIFWDKENKNVKDSHPLCCNSVANIRLKMYLIT